MQDQLRPRTPKDRAISWLAGASVSADQIVKMREKDGISLFRVKAGSECFVLKFFEKREDAREIDNYALLASLGIKTLPVIRKTECALLLPDLAAPAHWRLGEEKNLSDCDVARALARWYRALHDKGRALTANQTFRLYDESDVITAENMARIAEKTDTRQHSLWAEMKAHFAGVRKRIDALPRTLTYNDFYWTNLVVAHDRSEAFMLDFHLLGKGIAYGDIRNVNSALEASAKEAFESAYGADFISSVEKKADAFLSPLVTLSFATQKDTFPGWAEESLAELRNGTILSSLREWMWEVRP